MTETIDSYVTPNGHRRLWLLLRRMAYGGRKGRSAFRRLCRGFDVPSVLEGVDLRVRLRGRGLYRPDLVRRVIDEFRQNSA